jgi:hypothetical protein
MAKRKSPGTSRKGAVSWSHTPSFFDKNVQEALCALRDCPSVSAGSSLALFHHAEAVTPRPAGCEEFYRKDTLIRLSDEDRATIWRESWLTLGRAFYANPELTLALLDSVNRFHSRPPRDWRLGDKLAWLSTLGDRKSLMQNGHALLLPWPAVEQQLRKHFGANAIYTADWLRVEYSREQKRRREILREWQGEMDALNERNIGTPTRERSKSWLLAASAAASCSTSDYERR